MTIVRPATRSHRRLMRDVVHDVVAIGRPWFWLVSLLPYYIGFLLATKRLLPTAAELPTVALGAVVIGPLVWIAVLAVNDAHDVDGDRVNPRKAGTPLTSGRISPATAQRVAGVAGILAVGVALLVSPMFALGTLGAVLLGWAYSAPPLRLKNRPGADVLVNASALGILGQLAGWSVVEPAGDFPWVMGLLGTLVGAALYLPTTLADVEADRASGYTTIAVRLGTRLTYRLGLAAWVAAAGLSVVLAAADEILPRRMLLLQVVMVPVLIAAYRRLIGSEQSFRGVVTVATAFLLPSVTFALMYTGIW